jgi:hypothetical protein
MKSILSVVLGVMALGLVAGCSDDSDSVSCNFVVGGANTYCMTSSDISEDQCTQSQGTVVDSCPSGSIQSCKVSGDGKSGTVYVYSQTFAAMCTQ